MSIYSNRNVKWILIAGFLYSISSSIYWFTPTWMIYALGGSNEDLGFYLGISTISSVIVALISSVIADYYRRDILVWVGGLISVIGMYGMSISQNLDELFINLILATIGSAVIMPAIGGLFANSVTASSRNRLYGTQFLLNNGSGIVGNLLNFFIFRGLGSEIELIDVNLLRLSLQVGTVFGLFAVIAAILVRDRYSLTPEEEGSVASEFEASGKGKTWRTLFAPNAFKVIFITIISGMVIGFGGGTSIPYFPRFFFDIYKLDLSNLSLVFALLTVLTAVWGKVVANLGDKYNRVMLIFANQIIAVILLYFLATYPPFGIALVALFVRNAVMNGAGPLNNAIIMEFTPRKYRSITLTMLQISWSITFGVGQIFGGRLVDLRGFRLPFIITASLYLISSLIYLSIKKYDVHSI